MLARARGQRRTLSELQRGRERGASAPTKRVLHRRLPPPFARYRADASEVCGWATCTRDLSTTRRRELTVVDDAGEEMAIVVCDSCFKRETRKELDRQVRSRRRVGPASMHVEALDPWR